MAAKDAGPQQDPMEDKPLEKGGENDCSNGPVKNRSCTDVLCLVAFILHWIVFISIAGVVLGGDGDPVRLTAPRDWKGAFCGSEENYNPWNKSPQQGWNLESQEKMFFSMNVHNMLNSMGVQNVICTGAVKSAYASATGTPSAAVDEMCPTASSTPNVASLTSGDPSALTSGDPSMIEQMTTMFQPVCATSCSAVSQFALGVNAPGGNATARVYKYHPPPTTSWYPIMAWFWDNMGSVTGADAIAAQLTFNALPSSICADSPQYCVPFPGMEFSEIGTMCIFKLGAEASAALGAAAGAASDALSSGASGSVGSDFGTMVGDIQTAWGSFVLVSFLSLAIGFAFMVLLRFVVGILVWTAVALVFALLFAAGAYGFVKQSCESKTIVTPASGGNPATTSTTEVCDEPDKDARESYKTMAYIFFGLAGCYALFICCMFKRIQLGIAINKVAARFMYQTKSIILLPPVQAVIALVWFLVWFIIAMYVLSAIDNTDNTKAGPYTQVEAMGTDNCGGIWDVGCSDTPGECNGAWPTGDSFYDESLAYTLNADGSRTAVANSECAVSVSGSSIATTAKCYRCSLARFKFDTTFAYVFFSLLWNNALIVAIGQCTIAGAVAAWYFTSNETKGQNAVIRPALYNCFRYHFGSLAFGAFILAVVRFIKYALEYVKRNAEAQKNYVLARIAALLQCIVRCFERFVKFLNKNAYIQIAILGKNFCRSAWAAFCLILRNAARLGILAIIGGMVGIIGLVFICAVTTILGYFILNAMYGDEISSPVLCMIFFFMIGYIIAKLFMNVFSLAVDTVLQCFVADEELNKSGAGGGAQYTPEELKGFLKDPNKKTGMC